MRLVHGLVIVLLAAVWFGCSSTRWVHPSKNEDQLTYDWNRCERDWINNVMVNPGASAIHDSPMIERQRIFQCLQSKGWRQVEVD